MLKFPVPAKSRVGKKNISPCQMRAVGVPNRVLEQGHGLVFKPTFTRRPSASSERGVDIIFR
jgi:hypothetical protein